MYREILFRGKRVDTGEWVEGDFGSPCNIITIERGFDKVLQRDDEIINDYPVIPESVGQFTGLYDINGKRIFEGDIVQHFLAGVKHRVIQYIDGCFFALEAVKLPYPYALDINTKNIYTVVGNVYDNPEMLKARTKNKPAAAEGVE